jgi:hypothetical protein
MNYNYRFLIVGLRFGTPNLVYSDHLFLARWRFPFPCVLRTHLYSSITAEITTGYCCKAVHNAGCIQGVHITCLCFAKYYFFMKQSRKDTDYVIFDVLKKVHTKELSSGM